MVAVRVTRRSHRKRARFLAPSVPYRGHSPHCLPSSSSTGTYTGTTKDTSNYGGSGSTSANDNTTGPASAGATDTYSNNAFYNIQVGNGGTAVWDVAGAAFDVWAFRGIAKTFVGLARAALTVEAGASAVEMTIERLAEPNATTLKMLKAGVDVEVPAGTKGIRDTMSQLTLRTGNEVALLRMKDGRRILRMGGRNFVTLEGGVETIIAHTHPSGRLAFSAADIVALQKRLQNSSVIIDALANIAARILVP